MRPSLGTALSVAPRPSVCPSVRPSILEMTISYWNISDRYEMWYAEADCERDKLNNILKI